jgi:CheY-like chemotaxis protein
MTDNDILVFKDEDDAKSVTSETSYGDPWKILIIDDEEDVHNVTLYMLEGQKYRERIFIFLHAYTAEEAKIILSEHEDIAVILLDVVMESDDSGLSLVKYIREELRNLAVRIILRTGQPGKAPAARVIVEYDIDDPPAKSL